MAMTKIHRFTLLLAATLFTSVAALAGIPANYYNSALGQHDAGLMTALRNIIRNHTQLSYNDLWSAFVTTDTDDQGYIIDMYSNCRYKPSQHGGSASTVGEGFNREHSFPKSWFNDGYPMYTDLFHMYPTDIRVNNQRSNYPFGVCANGTRLTNGKLYGKGKLGTSTYPGYSGTVFEPDDEYKGDFARTYFYMVTCYKNELPSWSGSPQLNYSANGYKAFSTWSINMLMEWTRMDPVSEKEIKRNDAVHGIQGNRNPFIDHPELAEYIWGNKQGEAWGEDNPQPQITAPQNGLAFDMGTCTVGAQSTYMIYLEGKNLTEDLTLTISDSDNFSVNADNFSANEINSGTMLTVTFNPSSEGTFYNEMTLSSSEASTSFKVYATATKDDPEPPVILGDSIVEDWEGCTTGGYWTDQVMGNAFNWHFRDAGIWGDNLSHGEQSCRLGKSSSSAITMLESVEDVVAIGFYAASFGSDSDAELSVAYSTTQGSSWIGLGSVTVTRGALQHYVLDIDTDWPVCFGITQTSGSRVNIDDITIYRRVNEPIVDNADVNRDGEVNIADINAVIGAILSAEVGEGIYPDVNQDTEVNIADINAVIAAILGL